MKDLVVLSTPSLKTPHFDRKVQTFARIVQDWVVRFMYILFNNWKQMKKLSHGKTRFFDNNLKTTKQVKS